MGITQIEFDNAKWDVASLNLIAPGGVSFYKFVKEGSTHNVKITTVVTEEYTFTIELKRGKRYTWSISDYTPDQTTIKED